MRETREKAWRARETCSPPCGLACAVCVDREVWRSASSPRQRRSNRMLKFQSETATTWTELSGVIGSGRTHRWGVAEDRVMPSELFALLLAAAVGTRGHEQLCSSLRRPELHAPRRHCPESLCSAPLLAPSRCRCRFLPNWNAAEENAFLESVIFFCRGGLVCRLFSSSNS